MLNGMGLDHRLDILAVNKINLMEFLAMTDERLKTIGFEFKFERKRILQCLHRFHVHGWSKDSIKKPQKNSADELVHIECNESYLKKSQSYIFLVYTICLFS